MSTELESIRLYLIFMEERFKKGGMSGAHGNHNEVLCELFACGHRSPLLSASMDTSGS